MVSFCGYFPSEKPLYSCIVCIVKEGLPASGGGQCGPVFSEISQYVMAKGIYHDTEEAADSASRFVPNIANGYDTNISELLKEIEVNIDSVPTNVEPCPEGKVPNVIGMGAKDAVYALQDKGIKVKLNGTGKVTAQSIPAGGNAIKGTTISLSLN